MRACDTYSCKYVLNDEIVSHLFYLVAHAFWLDAKLFVRMVYLGSSLNSKLVNTC